MWSFAAVNYGRVVGQTPAGTGWERLFWLLFEKTTNPIIVVDEARKVVEINDAALTLFDRSRGEMIGIPIYELLKPSELGKSAAGWEELMSVGEYQGTRIFVRPDGTEITLALAGRIAMLGRRRLAVYVTIRQKDSWAISPPRRPSQEQLTPREREIVTLIAMGQGTMDIAEELVISPETVRTHVRNAMGKLGVHTRAELVAVVLCDGAFMDVLRLE